MKFRFPVALTALVALAACGGGTSGSVPNTSSAGGTSSLSAALMDAPFQSTAGTVEHVWITIAKVEALGNGSGTQTIATFSPSQRIDLLSLQQQPLTLGTATIPAGQYQQLRLVLDTSQPANTEVDVQNNGATTSYPLTIPSATGPSGFGGNSSTDKGDGPGTSGVKVNVGLDAQAGQSYGFVIDFNTAESIVQAGNGGQWIMKPVLVATAQAQAGAISGKVTNKAGAGVENAEVLAEQGTTVVNSSVTASDGTYQINALPAGSYTLVVKNAWTNQAGATETATNADGTADVSGPTVTVGAGQTANNVSIAD
jgi:hypothetical protein